VVDGVFENMAYALSKKNASKFAALAVSRYNFTVAMKTGTPRSAISSM
jgi:hypothetical protein